MTLEEAKKLGFSYFIMFVNKSSETDAWCIVGAKTCGDRGRRASARQPRTGDWLDPEIPIEWLADFLDLIRRTPLKRNN